MPPELEELRGPVWPRVVLVAGQPLEWDDDGEKDEDDEEESGE